MSPPPSKDQKDPNKNPPTEEIPSLEDIIGQMPKPDVDEITKLQVITKTNPHFCIPILHFRLVKYPMPAQYLVLSESNTITDEQLGQGCLFYGGVIIINMQQEKSKVSSQVIS